MRSTRNPPKSGKRDQVLLAGPPPSSAHGWLQVRVRAQFRTPRPVAPRHVHRTQDRRTFFPSVVLDLFASRLTHSLTLYSYRFSEDHEFDKPNDVRALRLMDE